MTIRHTLIALFVSFGLVACSAPTQKASVRDDRPLIMFENAQRSDRVIIDGIDFGLARDFKSGKSALAVEPGTHTLKVVRDGQLLLEKQFYISRGTSKVIGVPAL